MTRTAERSPLAAERDRERFADLCARARRGRPGEAHCLVLEDGLRGAIRGK